MEKTIRITALIDKFVIFIDDKQIDINYTDKSLDSKKLYEYIFKDYLVPTVFNFVNDIDEYFVSEDYNASEDENQKNKNKIVGEGKFILSKIEQLINDIKNEIDPLFQDKC